MATTGSKVKKIKKENLTVVLPTLNESQNIISLIEKILKLKSIFNLEIIIVDDESCDGTADLVRKLSLSNRNIRLINRIGRFGLSSAIKEGVLNSCSKYIAVLDADGQHDPKAIKQAYKKLISKNLDLVLGSRFISNSEIKGLSEKRKRSSEFANKLARYSLPQNYLHLTDYMTGFFILNRDSCNRYIRTIEVDGFKFLYELLSISKGRLLVEEIPLFFKPRLRGESKIELAVLWDFIISFFHTTSFRIFPRRAISFGLIGASGVLVQLLVTYFLMKMDSVNFDQAIRVSVIVAAISNYLINNRLTFRSNRLKGFALITGCLRFLMVASLPLIANIGISTAFYRVISDNTILAQIVGILLVFVWNYAASSRFVWNSP